MQFLLLLFLMLPCLQEHWATTPWFDSDGQSAALTWAAMAGVIGLALWQSQSVRRRLLLASPDLRRPILRRYSRARLFHTLTLFGAYATALFLLGWGRTVQDLWHVTELDFGDPQDAIGVVGAATASVPEVHEFLGPGAEMLILAPFLAAMVGSWVFFYDADRAIHQTDDATETQPVWGRWTYVSYHLRQNIALVFIPVALLIVLKALRRLVPESGTTIGSAVGFVGELAVFAAMPWLLRLVLGLHRLPDGPLRERLLSAARRLRFRCSDILLWQTRGNVANAMVAGLLPYPRYVLLTDRLAAELSPEELEAVFGHEVGHVKHRHMQYYLGFLIASMAVVWVGAVVLFTELERRFPTLGETLHGSFWENLAVVPPLCLLGAYIFVVFGFLSRRCERQADVYGCRAVSCMDFGCAGHGPGFVAAPAGKGLCTTGIGIFIDALEKVGSLNGISRDRPGWLQSWQHSTIARRVEFLQRIQEDSTLEQRFQRRVGMVKWALLGGLAVLLLVIGTAYGWEKLLGELS